MRSCPFLLPLFVALLAVALPAQAEQMQQFGDYQVHYSTLTTDVLAPEIARNYGISRSRGQGMLTLSVLRTQPQAPAKAVPAKVRASAVNQNSQYRSIDLREVRDGPAIYYLGQFRVGHQEQLTFNVDITPEGEDRSFTVEFTQRFYTR